VDPVRAVGSDVPVPVILAWEAAKQGTETATSKEIPGKPERIKRGLEGDGDSSLSKH
jgi:hypothetical protein